MLTFDQDVQYKSCAKYPKLSLEKNSYFFEASMYVSLFSFDLCIDWKSILKKSKTFIPSRAGPVKTDLI
jgi:hypothetical protein